MKVIRPIEIMPDASEPASFQVRPDGNPMFVQTDQPFLVSGVISNVPEEDFPGWQPGTYALGEEVIRNHHIFESLTDENTAIPGEEAQLPLKWLDRGATNPWRMFDKRAGTKWMIGRYTENPHSIDVTIQAGQVVNAIGIVGVAGASVRVVMTAPSEGIVYDRTVKMAHTGVTNWYDYWFAPFDRRTNISLLDLPAYGGASIQIIVSAPGGTARIGALVMGRAVDIGVAVYGTGLGLESYTATKEDDFGNVTLTPRGSRRTVDFDLRIPTERISAVMRTLEQLRDVPSLYIGHPDIDATLIVGRFDRLASIIDNPAFSEMTLAVRSLQ